MIRAFIAIDIAPQIIVRISDLVHRLTPRLLGIRWLHTGDLHLTLRFLGATEESKIDPIAAALADSLRPFQRFTINAKGLGVFPNLRQPRILWVGLVGSQLPVLRGKVESALTPLGFVPEQRPFTPHLTIGRWRQNHRSEHTLKQELERWHNHEFGSATVEEVILFESDLKPAGAIHRRLKTIPLGSDPLP